MDAYETLRKQAAQKRDALIKAARAEFRQSLRRIRELQLQLGGTAPKAIQTKPKPIIEMIADLAPRDRTFTLAEVVALLNQAEPNRKYHVPTIRTFFQRLEKQGMIRRVRRANGNVLWAAAGCRTPDTLYGAQSLTEVAADVLRASGPLRVAELLVAIRERGYRADADPHKLLTSLVSDLKRNPGRFRRDKAGRWSVKS
ncbi:MAG: hypothetical protein L0215_15975 [Gemmataceae bacterium]|nr:hypothetical protein [Gemmataceae bacterium]